METSVIPKDCPETVFSESKGVVECADFALVFAQTSDKYEKNEITNAVKYTHLEALVIKTRAGQHNAARAFIPYVEGSQIAFQKDYDLFDENGKPVWLTKKNLEFVGDRSELEQSNSLKKQAKSIFSMENIVSKECNLAREKNVMDALPTFNNPALNDLVI